MNAITYSLCQKPVLGLAMWITDLCVFPPLFSNLPIDLNHQGTRATTEFKVKVEKTYHLILAVEFESVQKRLDDKVVGNRFDQNCLGNINYNNIPIGQRAGLGQPIDFKVIVRELKTQKIIFNQQFKSLCSTGHNLKNTRYREIGWIPLKEGNYMIEVINIEAQTDLKNVKTTLSLTAGNGSK